MNAVHRMRHQMLLLPRLATRAGEKHVGRYC